MSPAAYDAWYCTPKGRWIGETEYGLLKQLLEPPMGASVIDVGCGTGYFTRHFAMDGLTVTGVDPDREMINFAQLHSVAEERYICGDARALPFPDRHFDYCVAVTSLCFMQEQALAIAEMVRVTRGRIALGLLNRNSILYHQKGRNGGSGAYHGAHWHTVAEVRHLFSSLPVTNILIRSAIYLPGAGGFARVIEKMLHPRPLFGGFLVVTGDIVVAK